MIPYTSKKDSLSTIPYYLPRLWEVVVLLAAASMMVPHAVSVQKTKTNNMFGSLVMKIVYKSATRKLEKKN